MWPDALSFLLPAGGGSSHVLARWLFLRSLGLVFLIAFLSLRVQLDGLLGSRGVRPVRALLEATGRGSRLDRLRRFPTLFWIDARDGTLRRACELGLLGSIALLLGIAPALSLLLLWALYLSFAAVGREFLSYQWDVLLLECAWIAALLAPWELAPAGGVLGPPLSEAATPVPTPALLLLWWLLFRLVFQSGIGKLTSGDPSWRDMTALRYHWWTQPLPTPTAWHLARFPEPFHRGATLGTHALEILFPLLLFGPPEARLVGCAGIVLLQLLIFGTGNYNFFNLLTIALAFLLPGDGTWGALLPDALLRAIGAADVAAWTTTAGAGAGVGPGAEGGPGPFRTAFTLALSVPAFLLGALRLWRTALPDRRLPRPLSRLLRWLDPLRVVNAYGLFRVMTKRRPEIVVEGSRDGERWEPYEFRYKPGDPRRRPRFVEPHQPRLDWQMWFAALGSFERAPWVRSFMARLLEGSGPVEKLLAENPFPDAPPSFVRATLYEYRFSSREERRRSGKWWTRKELGPYAPVLSRRESSGSRGA